MVRRTSKCDILLDPIRLAELQQESLGSKTVKRATAALRVIMVNSSRQRKSTKH